MNLQLCRLSYDVRGSNSDSELVTLHASVTLVKQQLIALGEAYLRQDTKRSVVWMIHRLITARTSCDFMGACS